MGSTPILFRATCRRCGTSVVEAPRIEDPELSRLRGHVRDDHHSDRLPPDAGIVQILEHYRISLVREDTDAHG